MYKIATLNKISQKGLDRLNDSYEITDQLELANGILVRSQDMKSMEFSDELLAIARAGAGTNNIPVADCAQKGIVVFNSPGANANSVKELVMAAMVASARNLFPAVAWTAGLSENAAKAVEKGKAQFSGHEVKGKVLGVIGLGATGSQVAQAGEALGMEVIGYSRHPEKALSLGIQAAHSVEELLPKCDYISLHLPVVDTTKEMINATCFSLMKNGVVLMNFARDTLVKQDDLFAALDSGKVRQYVTDFPVDGLVGRAGVLCIPHLGASTEESEDNCAIMAADELMDYLKQGNITNSVNYPNCTLDSILSKTRLAILCHSSSSLLSDIDHILDQNSINVKRKESASKGEFACVLIETDSDLNKESIKKALMIPGVTSVRIFSK